MYESLAKKAGLSNQELSDKIATIRREDPSITQKAAVGKAVGILRPEKAKEIFKEQETSAQREVESDQARRRAQRRQAERESDRDRQQIRQTRQKNLQRQNSGTSRASENENQRKAEDQKLATRVRQAAAAASAERRRVAETVTETKQMLSFNQYLEQASANFAGQGTQIAGLGGDEPIVRGQAQRMEDCSKCKGAGCPACTPTAFIIRRAANVAENVMRQLKAKRIADEVMEQATGGTGGNGGGGNGSGGNGSGGNGHGGNGHGNGKNGKHHGRGFRGHGLIMDKCPPGKVWDNDKKKCVSITNEGVTPVRCSGCKKLFDSGASFDKHDCPNCPKKLPGETAKAHTTRLTQIVQSKQGVTAAAIAKEAVNEAKRADKQVNVFIKSIKNKGQKKFAQAFVKSFGRKMPPPSKFGISDDDAAGLRSSIDRIQNTFAEAVENLDIPVAVATDIPADAEPTTKTYAGSPVFKVSPETFAKCSGGRAKWARWSKVLNLEDEGQAAIRTYANKYPSRPIVLQCDETGDMKFLRFNRKGGGGNRRRRKTALPTPTDGGTGQIVFDADNEQVTEASSARITASTAAATLRKRGHKLKANEIFSLAKTNKIGRRLRSPALGLVFTSDEVDKLDKILSENTRPALNEGAVEDMVKFLGGHLKKGNNPSRPSARELKGIITSADSGIEILDYVNTFFAFTEREWSFFVDSKRNRELAGSRKPADKEKLLRAVLKKIS